MIFGKRQTPSASGYLLNRSALFNIVVTKYYLIRHGMADKTFL